MRKIVGMASAAALVAIFALAQVVSAGGQAGGWNAEQRQRIASLSLAALPPLPADPSNAVADDPAAAALGKRLFADTRLSANGKVACATCHDPDKQFQDGLAVGHGVGTGNRRTMPIAGTAYSPWMFWDGRADSQWAQALGPLENPLEHGSDRASVVRVVAEHYAADYAAVFGAPVEAQPVDRVFANVGKAIAAFERTILPGGTRFDAYADAIGRGEASALLSAEETAGLGLFMGKGKCLDCHNGPLFTDNSFHNIGVPATPDDLGRMVGAAKVQADPFNCLGPFSDARPEQCMELAFIKAEGEELRGAFKTPSLRGVSGRAPFMHAGQLASIADVLAHYNAAPAATVGHSELTRINLTAEELTALAAFLDTLGSDEPNGD
ncbi:cytochrome c peroxidase [Devosia sp.]|uniref:cytochrome-c peroxidase n=1 Tax=Devosia sp. TaxID=1871048 RepID=UPI0025C370DA|nr:cytochrome c peroxidase [Devosia sp.]